LTDRHSISDAQQKIVNANLINAVTGNDKEKVELCLRKGADINARWRDWNERTPLMIAVAYAREDMVTFILSKSPELLLQDREGKTAFDLAEGISDSSIKKRINRLLLAALPDAQADSVPAADVKITLKEDDIPILKPIELDRRKKGGGSFQL
jgi:ankyrin repeat protein